MSVSARYRQLPASGSAGNALEHFSVRWELFHKHQETLNGFLWFVTGQSAPDEIDFLQFPRLQQQLFAACPGEKDVDRGINPLVADFSVKHHFHVSGAFKFLKDQLVHAAASFDQRRGDNRERTCFLGIARSGENFSRNFHGARVDTAAHRAATTTQCIIKRTSGARDGIKQDEYMFS